MGRLLKLTIQNFKSYKGLHEIDFGPNQISFLSIIGPNGSGKSNLMDAISFVLGIKATYLRSSTLSDLIYRPPVDSFNEPEINANSSATVCFYYLTNTDQIITFRRSVTESGHSSYFVNDVVKSFKNYRDILEKENILSKIRNFLVFQGDIENIASQTPKQLTQLIEFVSGSSALINEYDALKKELDQIEDSSSLAFIRRRNYTRDMKYFKGQKEQYDKYIKLQSSLSSKKSSLVLYKLYFFQKKISELKESAKQSIEEYYSYGEQIDATISALPAADLQYNSIQKKISEISKKLESTENEIQERIDKLNPIRSRLEDLKLEQKKLQRSYESNAETAKALADEIETLKNEILELEEQSALLLQPEVPSSNTDDLSVLSTETFEDLKGVYFRQAAEPENELRNLVAEYELKLERKQYLEASLLRSRSKLTSLQEDYANCSTKCSELQATLNDKNDILAKLRKENETLTAEKVRVRNKEEELNKELESCLTEILKAGSQIKLSKDKKKLSDAIDSLKYVYPGVYGTVSELCKPKNSRYELATATALGRYLDAIVVDSVKTASDCMSYLREQRAGTSMFLPLDTIIPTPINAGLRDLSDSTKLLIDILSYDSKYERIMSFVCSSTLICDDMETAMQLKWKNNLAAKLVTLDGGILHKAGLLTGGALDGPAEQNKWDEVALRALERKKNSILSELAGLAKEIAAMTEQNDVTAKFIALNEEVNGLTTSLKSHERMKADYKAEIDVCLQDCEDLSSQISTLEDNLSELNLQIEEKKTQCSAIEIEVFGQFYANSGISSFRDYEQDKSVALEKRLRARVEVRNRMHKLKGYLSHSESRLSELKRARERINNRLDVVVKSIDSLTAKNSNLENDKDKFLQRKEELLQELELTKENSKVAFSTLEGEQSKLNELEAERQTITQKILQDRVEISKTRASSINMLKNSIMEGISIKTKNDEDIDIKDIEAIVTEDEVQSPSMTSEQSQTLIALAERDIEADPVDSLSIDYSVIEDLIDDDHSSDIESRLIDDIKRTETMLDQLTPQTRAEEKMTHVQERLEDAESEYVQAARQVKNAKQKFEKVKAKRLELFTSAFEHISGEIDKIYKELTRLDNSPAIGSAYLTLDNTSEPYLGGIRFHAVPPSKQFRDIGQLSGGEKSVAALALLFAIHSFLPAPFFVLDEVDAALDNDNVDRLANYIRSHSGPDFQFIVISLKSGLFKRSDALIGVYRDIQEKSSKTLSLDLRQYPEASSSPLMI
ncbi:hypothetical protein CANCADRAFT_3915 [Tortispora caseinolytica NRRL Y-17796]|uniref:Structural maintenance of chromosomes protein n=1 Tax=Tortispora caseinolytica NRRL Y-17796 TaxID=767744 RepID=A0A1E4TCC0_9ASCO|nr:hypothetical protein CANCADRAFT_3915 [Tortispora caseinolytica NRRL Y-17796]